MSMNLIFKNPVASFGIAVLFGYTILSGFAYFETDNPSYLEVMWVSALSFIIIISVGNISLFGRRLHLRRISIDRDRFLVLVFAVFSILVTYLLATAPGIPLVAWFGGADQAQLVIMREEFLKARTGWESVLPYANSVLAGVFVPYAIADMFLSRHRWRWWFFLGFLTYCILFIEKVYFFKAILPLLLAFFLMNKLRIGKLLALAVGSILLLYLLGVVSGFGAEGVDGLEFHYFSNQFRPASTLDYLIWRAVSVPIFTTADTFSYFREALNSEFLYGASSGAIALMTGSERVFLERDVFAYQWGQTETGTGSSNAVFFADAFANFGVAGVVLYSIGVALVLGYFARTRDRALFCLWPLLAFGFYVSGFVSNLLSGGFLLIMMFSMTFRLVDRQPVLDSSGIVRRQSRSGRCAYEQQRDVNKTVAEGKS